MNATTRLRTSTRTAPEPVSEPEVRGPPHRLQRIIRERELYAYVGLRKSFIAELIAAGKFPKPIKLTDAGRSKGWLESDIATWQAGRIAARNREAA